MNANQLLLAKIRLLSQAPVRESIVRDVFDILALAFCLCAWSVVVYLLAE